MEGEGRERKGRGKKRSGKHLHTRSTKVLNPRRKNTAYFGYYANARAQKLATPRV